MSPRRSSFNFSRNSCVFLYTFHLAIRHAMVKIMLFFYNVDNTSYSLTIYKKAEIYIYDTYIIYISHRE